MLHRAYAIVLVAGGGERIDSCAFASICTATLAALPPYTLSYNVTAFGGGIAIAEKVGVFTRGLYSSQSPVLTPLLSSGGEAKKCDATSGPITFVVVWVTAICVCISGEVHLRLWCRLCCWIQRRSID